MKKIIALMLCCALIAGYATAQSKVFKEVSDEISSDMELIIQDGVLVGYLVFTRLEKVSEDSFNYKITIMDENLNDIGIVKFRNEKMNLQAVSFEQDVLCLAYLKSNLMGREFSGGRAYKKAVENSKTAVVTQFLNLDGKIIKENSIDVVTEKYPERNYTTSKKFSIDTKLKHSIQLANIPQKGFACIFGDENSNTLLMYNTAGNQQWKRNADDAQAYSLLTTNEDIFLLSKKKEKMLEGGYAIAVYGASDNKNHLNYELKDRDGFSLKVLGFGNDLSTGKPYVSGSIISKSRGNNFSSGKQIAAGTYTGVFNINFNGHKKADVKEMFSYWSDGSQAPAISKNGKYAENDAYSKFASSIRDYQGNTFFVGSAFVKKTKWGTIGTSLLLSPLIVVSPYLLYIGGTQKCKIRDAMILKQSSKGVLSFESTIDCNNTGFNQARVPLSTYDSKKFYQVANSNTKSNYVIVDDVKDIVIYNIAQKKIARTVSHKDGQIRTNIYPAKEGYVMVSEYNKKEKYTRLSIEAL